MQVAKARRARTAARWAIYAGIGLTGFFIGKDAEDLAWLAASITIMLAVLLGVN